MNDFFEAFNVGSGVADYPEGEVPIELEGHYAANTWPDVPGFREDVTAYFTHARQVARTLCTVFEDALGLPAGFFDDLTGHSIDVLRMNNYALPPGTDVLLDGDLSGLDRDREVVLLRAVQEALGLPAGWFDDVTRHPINVLRMNNYALPAGTDVTLDGDLTGMGEHTDYGIVTVLWADQERGLQVLDADRQWHDVQPVDGALLVNLGDLTTRLTNERWLSTLHRVKPPVVDGTIRRRRSAAFFHDGDADAVVAPLPAFVDTAGRAAAGKVTRHEVA